MWCFTELLLLSSSSALSTSLYSENTSLALVSEGWPAMVNISMPSGRLSEDYVPATSFTDAVIPDEVIWTFKRFSSSAALVRVPSLVLGLSHTSALPKFMTWPNIGPLVSTRPRLARRLPGSGLARGSNKASCPKLGPVTASMRSLYAGTRTLSFPVSRANPMWWLSPFNYFYSGTCCKMLLPSNPWTFCPSNVVGTWCVMTTTWFFSSTSPTSTSRSAMPKYGMFKPLSVVSLSHPTQWCEASIQVQSVSSRGTQKPSTPDFQYQWGKEPWCLQSQPSHQGLLTNCSDDEPVICNWALFLLSQCRARNTGVYCKPWPLAAPACRDGFEVQALAGLAKLASDMTVPS